MDRIRMIPLIAALLTFIGVAITVAIQVRNFKRQIRSAHVLKIADMRQAWINDLRAAMAQFQSYAVTPNLDHFGTRDFYEAGTRIELLMNPEDPDFSELQRAMYAFLPANKIHEKFAGNHEYVNVCQRILKREWEVLKKEVRDAASISHDGQ